MRRLRRALQLGALLLQAQQHGARRGESQRVPHKRSRKEGHADLGVGVVAVAPHATIERVQVGGPTRHDADGQAAADHFAVGRDIGAHAEQRLRAARMGAKAGDHFVEYQCRFGLGGDPAQLLQELARLQIGAAALHRLDEHGRQLAPHAP